MKIIGRLCGVLSLIGMLIGFVPFFGWLNWLVIPMSIVGLLLSIVSGSKGGTIICFIAIIFGILRLILGGGIV